jgi:ABC-2 type transport system ATP-binding protein
MAEVFLVPKRVWMERIESLLGVFELLDSADDLIETYSHGMRQKLALAAVLIHEPAVLFLDEPTNGLDPRAARVVKDVLTQICRRGATVFMTTHVMEVAQEMSDRVGVLHEGRLVACGSLDELRTRFSMPGATLEDIFLSVTGAPTTPTLALYQ